jgi:predicted NBD/HSP70 family sugar kinase
MSWIAEMIRKASEGEPIWLDEVREGLQKDPDGFCVIARLTLLDGGQRDFAIPYKYAEDAEERAFLQDYARAQIFNIFSTWSGRGMELYLQMPKDDGRWTELQAMLRGMCAGGYEKVFQVARRLCDADEEGWHSIEFRPQACWKPLPERSIESPSPLAPRLREAARLGAQGLRCGLDVGGTDIKIVVSRDGELLLAEEQDWDPSRAGDAEELISAILALVRQSLEKALPGENARPESLGLSFPDVVIRDRILGGETPKTRGLRRKHRGSDYEKELLALSGLNKRLAELCREGSRVHALNDGSMSAFSAAVELACAGEDGALRNGVFAHSLGTDLGSGWLRADGSVPPIPLELYDLLIDLGSFPQRELPAEDLRSTRNENSGLPGARRYLGQAAAYRLACEIRPELLEGEIAFADGVLQIRSTPEDRRKPCLEKLMRLAEAGDPDAEQIFRRIGGHLGRISREAAILLAPETNRRFLFGRFVRHPRCFQLLREGCAAVMPELELAAADEELAASPLMRALAARGEGSVARFGQAVGAIYYGLYAREEQA